MLQTRFILQSWITLVFACVLFLGCNQVATPNHGASITGNGTIDTPETRPTGTGQIVDRESTAIALNREFMDDELLQPKNLEYLGAFRLPEEPQEFGWGYSGYAMTYYPLGDPDGAADGTPGSLFILGHDQTQLVAEVSIPAPVLSESKDPAELNTAQTLQDFQEISGGMFGELEIARAGLEYLPPQDDQQSGKLYFCWGQHFQFEPTASHGWSELDLAAPAPKGPWLVGEYSNYTTNDYLFEIPEDWAARYAPGMRLATGRFRDGSWGGLGPALYAIAPWFEGNPPPPGATLQLVAPLLLYGENIPAVPEISVAEDHRMLGYSEPDEWSGGAWLTLGQRSAMVLVGTKAVGKSWYGFSNGVEYPISGDPDEEYPEVPAWPHDERGWWSEDISAQILFFDPAELGAVALGETESWEPQPYAIMTLDDFLFDPGFDYERGKRYLLGAAAFDRQNGLLYIVERMADENERSLIHAFLLEDRLK